MSVILRIRYPVSSGGHRYDITHRLFVRVLRYDTQKAEVRMLLIFLCLKCVKPVDDISKTRKLR